MSNIYIDLPAEASPRWKSPVTVAGNLPLNDNVIGDVRIAESTNTIYIWNGSAWIAVATPGAAIAIDGLIGDVTATGPGVVAATLVATTNATLVTLSSLRLPVSQLTSAGNLTDVGTDGIVITNGTAALVGTGTSIAQHVADTTHNGYLSSTDWTTFNNKQVALAFTNLTDSGTDGVTITNGTGAVIGASPVTISQRVSDTTHNGYLSSTDWNTFNAKQVAGNYITALTGDITASGPGSVAATLATVNSNVGSFTNAAITVNGKGLVTAASSGAVTNLTDVGTDGITITNGTGAVLGASPVTISQQVSDTTHNGYLNSTDWTTFNGKVGGKANLTTVGAVPYVSASGILSQDAANLFWDATNHSLGIGTNAPGHSLDVLGPARMGSGPASLTTLNGLIISSIPATGGALTVNSVTGYPTAGALIVGTEVITYTGISGSTFTGITRGALGSTAGSSANGTPVNYYLASASTSQTAKPAMVVAGDGTIGFGISAPTVSFDFQAPSSGSIFRFWATSTTNAQASLYLSAGSVNWTFYNKNNGPTGFWLGLDKGFGLGLNALYNTSINDSNFYDQLWVNGNLRCGNTPTTATTINAAGFGSGTTTMTVVSTTGYPTMGVLLVENEAIQYSGTTATTFTNLTRGYFGTTAAAHAVGVSVNNYLLNVVNVGGTAAVQRLSVLNTGDVGVGLGNILVNTVGKGMVIKSGANARIGQSTMVAGTIAVSNTSITANSRIFLTVSATGGTQGILSTTKSAGVSFTINSTNAADTSTVDWYIVESQ